MSQEYILNFELISIVFFHLQGDNEYKLMKLQCFHNPYYINDSLCHFRSLNRTTKVVSGYVNIYRQHDAFTVRFVN